MTGNTRSFGCGTTLSSASQELHMNDDSEETDFCAKSGNVTNEVSNDVKLWTDRQNNVHIGRPSSCGEPHQALQIFHNSTPPSVVQEITGSDKSNILMIVVNNANHHIDEKNISITSSSSTESVYSAVHQASSVQNDYSSNIVNNIDSTTRIVDGSQTVRNIDSATRTVDSTQIVNNIDSATRTIDGAQTGINIDSATRTVDSTQIVNNKDFVTRIVNSTVIIPGMVNEEEPDSYRFVDPEESASETVNMDQSVSGFGDTNDTEKDIPVFRDDSLECVRRNIDKNGLHVPEVSNNAVILSSGTTTENQFCLNRQPMLPQRGNYSSTAVDPGLPFSHPDGYDSNVDFSESVVESEAMENTSSGNSSFRIFRSPWGPPHTKYPNMHDSLKFQGHTRNVLQTEMSDYRPATSKLSNGRIKSNIISPPESFRQKEFDRQNYPRNSADCIAPVYPECCQSQHVNSNIIPVLPPESFRQKEYGRQNYPRNSADCIAPVYPECCQSQHVNSNIIPVSPPESFRQKEYDRQNYPRNSTDYIAPVYPECRQSQHVNSNIIPVSPPESFRQKEYDGQNYPRNTTDYNAPVYPEYRQSQHFNSNIIPVSPPESFRQKEYDRQNYPRNSTDYNAPVYPEYRQSQHVNSNIIHVAPAVSSREREYDQKYPQNCTSTNYTAPFYAEDCQSGHPFHPVFPLNCFHPVVNLPFESRCMYPQMLNRKVGPPSNVNAFPFPTANCVENNRTISGQCCVRLDERWGPCVTPYEPSINVGPPGLLDDNDNGHLSDDSRESESRGRRRPPTVICYLCGKEYGTASISIHEKQCLEKWRRANSHLPKKEQRPEPRKPELINPPPENSDSGGFARYGPTEDELNSFNDAARETFQQQFVRCERCGRTFLPDRLQMHSKGCRGYRNIAVTKPIEDATI